MMNLNVNFVGAWYLTRVNVHKMSAQRYTVMRRYLNGCNQARVVLTAAMSTPDLYLLQR
jgi:gamma-glutamylcysteine synthetase